MINKQEAVEQLNKLEAEMKRLKEIIEAPEPVAKKSLLQKPVPGSGDVCYEIMQGLGSGFEILEQTANNSFSEPYVGGNLFTKEKQAENYAKAFNTFLLLRHCEGSEKAVDRVSQFFIKLNNGGSLSIDCMCSEVNKIYVISPLFSTHLEAMAAIKVVGNDNILHMFHTFHGIYD